MCYPFAFVLTQRWRAKHSFIDEQQLMFTGTGLGPFGLWIKWFLLILVTLGVYAFWVVPRLEKWKWEHTTFGAPMVGYGQGAPVVVNITR